MTETSPHFISSPTSSTMSSTLTPVLSPPPSFTTSLPSTTSTTVQILPIEEIEVTSPSKTLVSTSGKPTPGKLSTCSTQTNLGWNCFYPSMPLSCAAECRLEFVKWLAGSKGLLTDLEGLPSNVLQVLPYDVMDSPPIIANNLSVIHTFAALMIPVPNVYLKVEVPGFYLKNDMQTNRDRYYTHIIEMKRYPRDELLWHVHVLPNITTGSRPTKTPLIYKKEQLAQFLAELFAREPSTSLDLIFKIPMEILLQTYTCPDTLKNWWNLLQKMKVRRNGIAWIPPNPLTKDEYKENRLFKDSFVYFQKYEDIPFQWKISLSSRHLLLFWLLKGDETPLTKPELHPVQTYGYPQEVDTFFRDWRRVTERSR